MVGWRVDDVVQLIRGKGGTVVRLQILPAGAAPGSPEKILALTRGKVSLESQAAKKEVRSIRRGDRDYKIGVINVPGFYTDVDAQRSGAADFRSTTRDVARLLGELRTEKIDGLVLDLRGNGGGYLPEAQSLTGLFINRGPVVQLKYRQRRHRGATRIRTRARRPTMDRWPYWSTGSAPRPRRSLPAPSRTTSAAWC